MLFLLDSFPVGRAGGTIPRQSHFWEDEQLMLPKSRLNRAEGVAALQFSPHLSWRQGLGLDCFSFTPLVQTAISFQMLDPITMGRGDTVSPVL